MADDREGFRFEINLLWGVIVGLGLIMSGVAGFMYHSLASDDADLRVRLGIAEQQVSAEGQTISAEQAEISNLKAFAQNSQQDRQLLWGEIRQIEKEQGELQDGKERR